MFEKLVAKLQAAPDYILPFLVILTVLVFVHEMGHYLLARYNGVRVEVFSIGFGPELVGWNDAHGTRWKISLIPLGGYVKMFGEGDEPEVAEETAKRFRQRGMAVPGPQESFHNKTVGQRAAIVVAGPAANYAFAILIFAALFATIGQRVTTPVIGEVIAGSVAEKAGFKAGDTIASIDGEPIARFEQIINFVQLRPGVAMDFVVERDGKPVTINVTPMLEVTKDPFGNEHKVGRIGLKPDNLGKMVQHGPVAAVGYAVQETASMTWGSLTAIGQMIVGTRSSEELGGPVMIAKYSGDIWKLDVSAILWFMASLSISLGLINLFPVPMLDGGHLLFYAYEAARGRPLGARLQEYGFRIGLALVLGLLVFATWNDLRKVFQGVIT